MKRAVDDLTRSVKDVDRKLHMLEWRVGTLSQNYYGTDSNKASKHGVDVLQFVKDTIDVKKECTDVTQDLKATIDLQKESMDSLGRNMEIVMERYTNLIAAIGESG